MTISERMTQTTRCIEKCEQALANPEISPKVKRIYREELVQHVSELRNLAERRLETAFKKL